MRYVRTRKGLSPAPVNLVTREMGKSVNVNISVAHAIIAFSAFNLLVKSNTICRGGLSRGNCSHTIIL